MLGDEPPLNTMTSTTMTMNASATGGTHRARDRERLAGGTAVKLPRGWARAVGSDPAYAARGDPRLRAAAHRRPSTGRFDESRIVIRCRDRRALCHGGDCELSPEATTASVMWVEQELARSIADADRIGLAGRRTAISVHSGSRHLGWTRTCADQAMLFAGAAYGPVGRSSFGA